MLKYGCKFIAIIIVSMVAVCVSTCSPGFSSTITPNIDYEEIAPMAAPTGGPTTLVTPRSNPTATNAIVPLPTLSPIQASQKIHELIATNGGCELPCWWGIMPGKSKWDDTYSFLRTFAMDILPLNMNNGYVVLIPNREISVAPSAIDIQPLIFTIYTKNGLVDSIQTDSLDALSGVLKNFGQPEEVWFYYDLKYSRRNYYLGLYYPKRGMAFFTSGIVHLPNTDNPNLIEICTSNIPPYPLTMYLFSPLEPKTLQQMSAISLNNLYEMLLFKPIEETTNMNVFTFTQTFSNESNSECIHSSTDIWVGNPPVK